jgi:hypothetical protein
LKVGKELTNRNASKGGKPDKKLYHPYDFRKPKSICS